MNRPSAAGSSCSGSLHLGPQVLCFPSMLLLPVLLASLALAAADAPRQLAMAPRVGTVLGASPGEVPQSLQDARRLADQLRYEEAIVEYQRYLGVPARPVGERAKALLEVGFIHLLLGDEVTAEARATEALELDETLASSPQASAKQNSFLERMKKTLAGKTLLQLLPRSETDGPQVVRARLVDPQRGVKRVLIRHALSPKGPYYSSPMRCAGETCAGDIPSPVDASSFTAFYFVEAQGKAGDTLAQAASATQPLQLAVVGRGAWYKSPWVWGAGGAAAIAIAGMVYLLSPQPAR